ncbi:hypothetical protein [Gellertiella hungarica]|uniref:Uncharacterized protein n=1 Tax=Gellertiella hungarica TaxID=1572859 RepID=A0A7W6J7N0_9HYPH|nr:hypothetical protein [Gellertiella hungarica]MBB4066326.1 hypothetical protein [Gellertiella hungarica]
MKGLWHLTISESGIADQQGAMLRLHHLVAVASYGFIVALLLLL